MRTAQVAETRTVDRLDGIERIPVGVAASATRARQDACDEDISGAKNLDDLTKNAQSYVKVVEELSRAPNSAIGVGPGRDQTIVVRHLV